MKQNVISTLEYFGHFFIQIVETRFPPIQQIKNKK